MKKIVLALMLMLTLVFAVSCKINDGPEEPTKTYLTHEEYLAAEIGAEVTVRAYVQGKQSWWDNKAVIYAADYDGGYLFYNMACTEEEYAKLVNGTCIEVTGTKAEYKGEIEIAEGATFKIIEDSTYTCGATDVTDILANSDELIKHQNELVAFNNLTVVAKTTEDGEQKAFFYKWNNSGSQGDDLYFDVTDGKNTYTFTVESYLCDKDSDVYKAVEALEIGHAYDFEGFCYWYDGLNPHITSVKSNYMTHAEYDAADLGAEVTVRAYVQGKQSWWDNKAVIYAADAAGGYLFYNMACTEEEYGKLVNGTWIEVTGTKAEYKGEVELAEGATFKIIEGQTYIAEAKDVTSVLSNADELIKYQNEYVAFKGLTVVGKSTGEEVKAFFYKWNNSGSQGDDLYFDVTDGTNTYTFTVESYLCGKDTDVYKAIEALEIGSTYDFEGFCYWYDGLNPHITKVTKLTD